MGEALNHLANAYPRRSLAVAVTRCGMIEPRPCASCRREHPSYVGDADEYILVPRLSVGAALARLHEIELELRAGTSAGSLVQRCTARPSPIRRAEAPRARDLVRWRSGISAAMEGLPLGRHPTNAKHSMRLGTGDRRCDQPEPK